MKVSKQGIDLIAKWEGFRSNAYQDIVGVWTIGYGHTKGVKKGDKITKKDATELLEKEIEKHTSKIFDYVKVKLTQGQFDALASFHYNLGANILKGTTLLNTLNDKDWKESARQMKRFNKAGGKVVRGLVNRREEEAQLFLESSPHKKDEEKEVKTSSKYRVKAGDNLSKIAKRNGTTVKKLMSMNPSIKNANLIYPNQLIVIPSKEAIYTIQKGDTLSEVAYDFNLTLAKLLEMNPHKKKNPNLVAVGEKIKVG